MMFNVFVAGASGAIGKPLVLQLIKHGIQVFGTTRSATRAADLERAGAIAIVLDAYDRDAVVRAVEAARPDVVIHQWTDLSGGFAPDRAAATLAQNSRIRVEGTRNLMDAARAAKVRRVIAQSISWVYAPGREPHVEDDPLDYAADGVRAVTVRGVIALESAVLGSPPIEGVVLRYGWFYGPGANATPAGSPGVHVDDAANAAFLAVGRGAPGIYNVAEAGPHLDVGKAERELGWKARCT